MPLHYKNYIGIDISKSSLDIAILRPKTDDQYLVFKIDNTVGALKEFKRELRSFGIRFNKESLVVFEHTGVYKTHLVNFLITQRCPICIESAFRIKRSLGIQRGKNDQIDAKRIATYAFVHEKKISIWQNPKKELLMLKDLLINRDRMQKVKKLLQLPLNEFKVYYSKRDYQIFASLNQQTLSCIDEALDAIDLRMNGLIENEPELRTKMQLLRSVPGIGRIVAINLLCYTNEFTLYKKASQLASYVGIAPFEFRSGTSIKGKPKVHPFANKKLKSLIHISAVANLRSKNELRDYYDRKLAEGKSKMSVLNAVRNKIIKRVAAVVARSTPYTKIKKELSCDPELYHVQGS